MLNNENIATVKEERDLYGYMTFMDGNPKGASSVTFVCSSGVWGTVQL